MSGFVVAVSRSATHSFSKANEATIRLLVGLGVDGDAHQGVTVKHRSRVARDPNQPNLRQVHLIQAELHDELRETGFELQPGEMGENITTRGIDLLSLPAGTRLRIGDDAVVEITGLRNPCVQIDRHRTGLLSAVAMRDEHGTVVRKAGVMSIVIAGGEISPGDRIDVARPAEPHVSLGVV